MTSIAELGRIDFTDLDNFADGFPHDLFALHRELAPVYWHEPTEHTPTAKGSGRWPVTLKPLPCCVIRRPTRR